VNTAAAMAAAAAVLSACAWRLKKRIERYDFFFQLARFFLYYNKANGPAGPNLRLLILVVRLFATCPLSEQIKDTIKLAYPNMPPVAHKLQAAGY
jgi:hypothetical protein